MDRRLYFGAELVEPDGRGPVALLVEDGQLVGVERTREDFAGVDERGLEELDCDGCLILPGLFDTNVHLREPGREDTETIASGSAAALHGGFTGMLVMPNTDPPIDSGGMVRSLYQLAREESAVDLRVAGCITKGRRGEELAELGDMAARGALLVTDDHCAVRDARLMRRAMEYARGFGLIVGSHPDTPELSRGGAMNEGEVSYRLGLPGIPACAEELGIARDLRLAELTGARLHLQHVSTAEGVATIRRYRQRGVLVSAEATPHHLLFDEAELERRPYDTHLKMTPPLRVAADREAVLEGLRDGTLDVIATDHAPHSRGEKGFDFAHAPFGVTGLETALVSLYQGLVIPGLLDWEDLVGKLSAAPRQLLGLEPVRFESGQTANFTVFDPAGRSRVDAGFLRGKSRNSAFWGQELRGQVRETVFGRVRGVYWAE